MVAVAIERLAMLSRDISQIGSRDWPRRRRGSRPAEASFLDAIAIARRQNAKIFELRSAMSLARYNTGPHDPQATEPYRTTNSSRIHKNRNSDCSNAASLLQRRWIHVRAISSQSAQLLLRQHSSNPREKGGLSMWGRAGHAARPGSLTANVRACGEKASAAPITSR
jgi:hypothetical protein